MSVASPSLEQLLAQAIAHHNARRLPEAEAIYRRILDVDRRNPDALHRLGLIATDFGRFDDAVKLISAAATIRPDNAQSHIDLSMSLYFAGRVPDAIAAARRAIELNPALPDGHYRLALALYHQSQSAQALDPCLKAYELAPQSIYILSLLCCLFSALARPRDTLWAAERGIALDPNEPRFHWSRALSLLATGEFAEGWREFDWRLRGTFMAHLHRQFDRPMWQGEDLAGRTILLYCEGGFGDAIQFVRFLPRVAAKANKVILECQQPLLELFKSLSPSPELKLKGEPPPGFDYVCPLQSLPARLGTTLENIPAEIPYLRADARKAEQWRPKLAALPPARLRVGLAWAGSAPPRDGRSRTLDTFAPLASVPGVQFISLQKGPHADQAQTPPDGMKLANLSADVSDFADLAAIMEHLDLVISVDTSVAHLAGALGKPAWVLIPFVSDFRWLLDRTDSPWYPTMRLFRQTDPAETTATIEQMAAALRERVR